MESSLGGENNEGVAGIDFALPGRSISFFFLSGDKRAPFKRALGSPEEVTDLRGFIRGAKFSLSSVSFDFVAGAGGITAGMISMHEARHTSNPG